MVALSERSWNSDDIGELRRDVATSDRVTFGPIIRPPRRAPAWPPSAAKRPADGGDAHDRVEADAEELEVSVFSERVRVLGAGVNRRLAEGAVRERQKISTILSKNQPLFRTTPMFGTRR